MAAVNDNSSERNTLEARLMRVIAECMERQDRGEEIDRPHLLRENPEIARDLLEYFENLDAIEKQAPAREAIKRFDPAERDSVSIMSRDQSTDHPHSFAGGKRVEETRVLPQQVGRYQVLHPLGHGGMGTVFLVYDPQLHRKVALKLPRISGPDKSAVHARFLVEAKAAARLRHPHICRVYDFGEIDGTPFYTMDYVEGTPLSETCPKTGFANITDAIAIVRSVADAMNEAHNKGLIHRDLKPSNIILDEHGLPVVVDFGLAREIIRTEDSALTETGMIVGTVGYMSPEQISGRTEAIGPQSDIWSLGIILHELLTGRQPFVGSQTDVLAQILRDDPPKVSNHRPDIPPALDAICLKMLEKNLSSRYTSMSEVVAALDVFLNVRGWHGFSTPPVAVVSRPPVESTIEAMRAPVAADSAVGEQSAKWKLFAAATSILVTIGIVLAVIVVRIQGATQTVELHLDPAIIQDEELTVVVDDGTPAYDEAKIDKNSASIKLKVGTYEIRVLRGRDTIVKKQKLQVHKGDDNVVRLTIGDPAVPSPAKAEPFPLDLEWRQVDVPYERVAEIIGLAFGSDSRTLTIATSDTVEIYDPYTKLTWGRLPITGKPPILDFAASRDGRFAAVVFNESIEIFNVPERKSIRVFPRTLPTPGAVDEKNTPEVASKAAFSDDGRFFAAATELTVVRVWNTEDGRVVQSFDGEPGVGRLLTLSPDGSLLAIGKFGAHASLAVLEVASKNEKFKIPEPGRVRQLLFTPDGQHVLSSGADGVVTAWKTSNGDNERAGFAHAGRVTSLGMSTVGRHLVSGSKDRTFRVWDSQTWKSVHDFTPAGEVEYVAMSPDGMIIAASTQNSLHVVTLPATLRVEPGKASLVASLFHPFNGHISATALSPNGRSYAAAGRSIGELGWDNGRGSKIAIWDLATRTIRHQLDVGSETVGQMQYSPDSTMLMMRSSGSRFRFWNAETGELLKFPKFDGMGVGILGQGSTYDFDFLPDGNLVLVGNQGLQIIDSKSLSVKAQWPSPVGGGFRCVAAFRDRMDILTGIYRMNHVHRWNVGNAKPIDDWKIAGGPFGIDSIRISASGEMALTGSLGAYELWNLAELKNRPLVLLDRTSTGLGLSNEVSALNSEGTQALLAANGSDNQAVFLFNLATGKVVSTLAGHDGEIKSAHFSPDDRVAICASGNGSVKIWVLPKAPDSDREAAEWVLSKGGRLGIEYKRERRRTRLTQMAELTNEPFWIWDIDLKGVKGVPSQEFSHISGLTRLYQIILTDAEISDDAIAQFNGLPTLTTLQLSGTGITDACMQSISRFPNLTRLEVARTQISNTFASQLLAFPLLEQLILSETKVDDNAAPFLRGLHKLRMLSLGSTQFTDKGIQQLTTLRRLVHFDCPQTGITAEGINALKREIPQVNVQSDVSP